MRLFFLSFFLLFSLFLNSQGYKIKLRIDGLKDTTVLLAYHFRDKIYTVDSIYLNSKGKGVAKSENKLQQGQYLFYLPNGKYFDILIDYDQKFFVRNNANEFISNFKIRGSKSNKLLRKFSKKIHETNLALNRLQKLKLQARTNKDSVDFFNSQIAVQHAKQQALQEEIRKGDDKNLFYSLFKTTLDPETPEHIRKEDSLQQYYYYKKHFLDLVNFSDERLIRTNHLYYKINQYLNRIVYQHYDSIAYATDEVIAKTPEKSLMRQFITDHLLGFYATSKYMTHRNIFVHLAEKHYLSGEAFWSDSIKISKIKHRVNAIKPTLVDQIAPDLNLFRDNITPTSLHELVADYTILFFYEPDCGHCKEYTPKIKEISDQYWSKGVEVFAVYTLVDTAEWNLYISENNLQSWNNVFDPYRKSGFYEKYNLITTPKLYLLDNNKKIILSDVGFEQLRDYFTFMFNED
jgi:thiol-disulfide isomerase/thioredoxin